MKLISTTLLAIVLSTSLTAQTNFNGTYTEPELEMIDGIQYANALPSTMKVKQTKDSITIVSTYQGGTDGEYTSTGTFALNGKTITRKNKSGNRTITSTATFSTDGKKLTVLTTFSYENKPTEAEYKNTEIWEVNGNGTLIITKTSDATVTDDWTIKGSYQKS